MMPILAGNNEKEQGMKHTHHSPSEARSGALCLCIALAFSAAPLSAQARVEENVVYGMYFGLALLMDVHHPAEPNGYGIILIPGSYSSDFEEDRAEERYCYRYRGAFERHEVALATNGMNMEF